MRDGDQRQWIVLSTAATFCDRIASILIFRKIADLRALGVPRAELEPILGLENASLFADSEIRLSLRERRKRWFTLSRMLEDKLAIEKEAVSDYPTWRDYNVTILCIRFYCLLKYKVKLKARCAGVIRSFFGNIKPGTRLRYAIHKLISRARLLQRAVKCWISERFESHREISIRWIKLELDMIKMKWIAEQIDKIEDLKARIANTTAMGLPADLLELKQLEKTKAAYRSIVRPASANERAIQITVMQKEMIPRPVRLCAVGYMQSMRVKKLREISAQYLEDIKQFKRDLKTWKDIDDAVRMISPNQDTHIPRPPCPSVPRTIATVPDSVIEEVIRRLHDEVGGGDPEGESKRQKLMVDFQDSSTRGCDSLWEEARQSPSGRFYGLHPKLDKTIISIVEEAIGGSKNADWIVVDDEALESHDST